MLNIIICDDNIDMVRHVKKTIENLILIEEMNDVKIELATTNQHRVMDLFTKKGRLPNGDETLIRLPLKERLLFLDINYGSDLPHFDGIKLGSEIRKFDINCSIAYISSNGSERRDVIEEKIEPFGYIHKILPENQINAKIIDLVKTARERMYMSTLTKKMIEFRTGRGKRYVNLADIFYVQGNESKEKKLDADGEPITGLSILHTKEGTEPLTRKLKMYDEEIPDLIRLGKSYLVNPLNVRETRVSAKKGKLKMSNGDELSVGREAFNEYEAQVKRLFQ